MTHHRVIYLHGSNKQVCGRLSIKPIRVYRNPINVYIDDTYNYMVVGPHSNGPVHYSHELKYSLKF